MKTMIQTFLGTVQAHLDSRKSVAFAGTVITFVIVRAAGRLGWHMDDGTAKEISDRIVAVGIAYLAAQGAADWGKGKTEVQVKADAAEAAKA